MSEPSGATLLFSVYIPTCETSDDPEMIADELVAIVNEERRLNAGVDLGKRSEVDVQVGLFPGAQWLTAEALADLRGMRAEIERLRWFEEQYGPLMALAYTHEEPLSSAPGPTWKERAEQAEAWIAEHRPRLYTKDTPVGEER